MANDTNLSLTTRAVKASVVHLADNGYKFDSYGALEAMQDPQLTALRQAINPLTMPKENTLAWVTKAGRSIKVPKVEISYKPQIVQTAITERTKPSTGTTLTDAATQTVYFDKHWEYTWKKTIPTELLEPAAQNYLRALLAGNLTMGRDSRLDGMMNNLAYEMYGSMVPTIFGPANTYVVNTAIAAVGKNKAFPTATGDSPCIQVEGHDNQGNPKRDIVSAIMNTKVANKINGKPILIGGLKWLTWHRDMGLYKTNQDGLDFTLLYSSLPWVFYYDEQIDTLYGANKAILFDPAAMAFDSIAYHGPAGLYAGIDKNSETYFETGSIRFTQFKGDEPGLANTAGVMQMMFDLRVAEIQDTYDQPEKLITPSFSCGMYTRPLGFWTANTADIMNKVTGVFGFEMTHAS